MIKILDFRRKIIYPSYSNAAITFGSSNILSYSPQYVVNHNECKTTLFQVNLTYSYFFKNDGTFSIL